MKTSLLFHLVLLFLSLTLAASLTQLARKSKSSSLTTPNHRLKAIAFARTRKFSCVCGPYVPLCDMIFGAIKIQFNIDVTAKANPVNKGEFFTASCQENYHLKNVVARIESPTLKKLVTAIGLDTIALKKPQLVISTGEINGATFSGKLTYLEAEIDFQVVFIKGLQIDFWVGMTLSFPSVLTSIQNVMKAEGKELGDGAKKMLRTLEGSTFTMVFQTGGADFKDVPELEPGLLKGVNKDKIASSKIGLTLLAEINVLNIKASLIGGWLDRVGVKKISLLAKIEADQFYAEASLDQIKIGVFTFISPGLYFKLIYASPQSLELGIQSEMTLTLSSKTFTFSGALLFSTIDVGFKFKMSTLWSQAFGLARLHFGRLSLALKLAYANAIPTEIVLGGELAIGSECYDEKNQFIGNKWCLHSQAYVGVSLDSTYLYLKSESCWNMQTIVTALFGSKTGGPKIPNFLTKSLEIHDGMVVSFYIGKEKEKAITFTTYDEKGDVSSDNSVKIPQGFTFEGRVSLLSVTSHLVLKVTTSSTSFVNFEGTIDVENKIKFGKVLEISNFDEKSEKGPLFSLKLEDSKLSLTVNCRVKIFDFSVGTNLIIEEGKVSFSFDAQWKYFPLMIALNVETSYSQLAMNRFHLKGQILKNKNANNFLDLIKEIGGALKGTLNDLITKLGGKIADSVKKGWTLLKVGGQVGLDSEEKVIIWLPLLTD